MDLPLGLVSAIESGECVLFLGSGVGYNMLAPDGEHAPDGTALATALVRRGINSLTVVGERIEVCG